MSKRPPNQELNVGLDQNDEPKPQGDPPEDGMREMPTDPPAVVPAMSAEQFGVAAGVGLSGFAKQNPEGGLTGDPEEEWIRDPNADDEATDG